MTQVVRGERRPLIVAWHDRWEIHVLYRGNEDIAFPKVVEAWFVGAAGRTGELTPEFLAWAEMNMPDRTVVFSTVNCIITTRCENAVLAFRMRYDSLLSRRREHI